MALMVRLEDSHGQEIPHLWAVVKPVSLPPQGETMVTLSLHADAPLIPLPERIWRSREITETLVVSAGPGIVVSPADRVPFHLYQTSMLEQVAAAITAAWKQAVATLASVWRAVWPVLRLILIILASLATLAVAISVAWFWLSWHQTTWPEGALQEGVWDPRGFFEQRGIEVNLRERRFRQLRHRLFGVALGTGPGQPFCKNILDKTIGRVWAHILKDSSCDFHVPVAGSVHIRILTLAGKPRNFLLANSGEQSLQLIEVLEEDEEYSQPLTSTLMPGEARQLWNNTILCFEQDEQIKTCYQYQNVRAARPHYRTTL